MARNDEHAYFTPRSALDGMLPHREDVQWCATGTSQWCCASDSCFCLVQCIGVVLNYATRSATAARFLS